MLSSNLMHDVLLEIPHGNTDFIASFRRPLELYYSLSRILDFAEKLLQQTSRDPVPQSFSAVH